MNNIVEAVFGTCNPYECATRILYRYDYGMILTFPDLELPTAYEVHFSNYDDVGTTITQIGNEDGVSIPDEFLQTGLPVYCWVYLHTGEDDGETVYKVTINVQDRPQPSNGTPTPVQQDAITEAIAALDSAVEQTGADASSANADALKSEGYAVGTQDGEPVEQGSPYYRHNSLWLSQQSGQSANKAEAQASLSEAWAVGEISGHPVSSDYPQYENNSKYYAEQASQSAEDAEESAQSVLGLTADATVDSNVGTPSVSVSVTTESDHKNMSFAFHNLKGVQGDTGVGISSVTLNADYTLTITLTNGNSYTTYSIRGEVGATPNLTIGTVSTLPEGSQATATITGTDEDPVLNLGIPVGDTGDPGISPTIKVTSITCGHEVEVVDAQGTQTFDVMDGLDGQSGLITDYIAKEKTPYLFRPSANGLANVISEKDMIVGGTVAWNQLAHDFVDRSETLGITIVADNTNGTITVSGTATATNNLYFQLNVPLVIGHKYLLRGAKPGSNTHGLTLTGGYTAKDSGDGTIASSLGTRQNLVYWFESGAEINVTIHPQLFDLTQMFGSTIADYLYTLESGSSGSGIAKLKSWGFFTKDYYPYNSGDLLSVQTSEHRMTGFNQWDEMWESGQWIGNITTKVVAKSADATRIRSKNYIPVIPDTTYYYTAPRSGFFYFFDANGNWINSTNSNGTMVSNNTTFTTPSNAYSALFFVVNTASYNNDICINLHWDGERDGEYEAYKEHSYALDPDLELRGILKLDTNDELYYDGDTYESDGTVTRKYGIVDLGTLTWTYQATNLRFYSDRIKNVVKTTSGDWSAPFICSKYKAIAWNSLDDKFITLSNSNGRLFLKDTAYTDATLFTTSLSGVYLVYELATPTTETADPYSEYQIVDADGTEEYVDERTVPIPVGHDTYYQQSVDVPQLPTTDGAYRLALSLTGNTATASWEYVAQAEMKAQTNIPSGKYFSVGERLFISTQAIAQGANIVVGTNCTETTLADALNTINS